MARDPHQKFVYAPLALTSDSEAWLEKNATWDCSLPGLNDDPAPLLHHCRYDMLYHRRRVKDPEELPLKVYR